MTTLYHLEHTLLFPLCTGLLTLLPTRLCFSPFLSLFSSLSKTSDTKFTLGLSPPAVSRKLEARTLQEQDDSPGHHTYQCYELWPWSRVSADEQTHYCCSGSPCAIGGFVESGSWPSILPYWLFQSPWSPRPVMAQGSLFLTVHSVLKDLGRTQAGPTEWIKCQVPNAANRNNSWGISIGRGGGRGRYF